MLKDFNAAVDGWLPCLKPSGESEEASLVDVFDPGKGFVSFADGTWGNLPYINLCVAVATDACRPQTTEEIQGYLDDQERFAQDVRAYLSKNEGRFSLTGSNPFLQVGCFHIASLSIEKPEHIRDAEEQLLGEGKTTTQLREAPKEKIQNAAQLTRALLKSLVCGCNKKTLDSKNRKPNLTGKSPDQIVDQIENIQPKVSPIRTTNSGSSGTLNIYVTGGNLIETIILNMIPEDLVRTVWPKGFGVPIYLHDTCDHTVMKQNHSDLDATFLGHLVPLTKYLKILTPEELEEVHKSQEGKGASKIKEFDPGKFWMLYNEAPAYKFLEELENVKKAGGSDNTYFMPCHNPKAKYTRGTIIPNSYLWKEFGSLDDLQKAPLVLSKFADLTGLSEVAVHAVGMQGSGTSGLVYDECVYESSLFLEEGAALSEFVKGKMLHGAFQDMTQISRLISDKLYRALMSFLKDLRGGDAKRLKEDPLLEETSREYWQRLDSRFREIQGKVFSLQSAEDKEELCELWEKRCRETARGILSDIKDGSVRRNKAVAKAMRIVTSPLKKERQK